MPDEKDTIVPTTDPTPVKAPKKAAPERTVALVERELRNMSQQNRDLQGAVQNLNLVNEQLRKDLDRSRQSGAATVTYFNAALSVLSDGLENLRHQIQLYKAQEV